MECVQNVVEPEKRDRADVLVLDPATQRMLNLCNEECLCALLSRLMCAEMGTVMTPAVLLQLNAMDISNNRLTGPLPSTWGSLTQVSP